MITPNSQSGQILLHLKAGKTITPLDALKLFGCFRLGARIFDLREHGFNIKSEPLHENGKHFAKYRLIETKQK